MNRGINASASGMAACQNRLDSIASNLSHLSVTGWKGEGTAFANVYISKLRANAGEGADIGTAAFDAPVGKNFVSFVPGRIEETGNALDLAVNGPNGMFAVQTAQGIRFTRDGSFRKSTDGHLVDRRNNPVLDKELRPITLPDGTISVDEQGQLISDDIPVASIGVFDGQFARASDGFTSDNARHNDKCVLAPKCLESSNVDPIASMVEMIQLNRQFELAHRSITTQDELTQKLLQSLQNAS